MAYDVSFIVPERPVGRKDIEFHIKKDGAMLGTLKVSQGLIVWRPRDSHYGYGLGWQKLDELAKAHGRHRAV